MIIDVDGNGEIDFEEFVQLFKGTSRGNEGRSRSNTPVYKRKESSLFDNAKQFIQFGPMLRFVTWLYSGRKLLLLLCSHFVASLIIWGMCLMCTLYFMHYVDFMYKSHSCLTLLLAHFAMIRYEQQEGTVPEDASRYTAKRIVPPFLYGSKHCSRFSFFFMCVSIIY